MVGPVGRGKAMSVERLSCSLLLSTAAGAYGSIIQGTALIDLSERIPQWGSGTSLIFLSSKAQVSNMIRPTYRLSAAECPSTYFAPSWGLLICLVSSGTIATSGDNPVENPCVAMNLVSNLGWSFNYMSINKSLFKIFASILKADSSSRSYIFACVPE